MELLDGLGTGWMACPKDYSQWLRFKWNPIMGGVPQGFIVGPVLINVFTNDRPSRIHPMTKSTIIRVENKKAIM